MDYCIYIYTYILIKQGRVTRKITLDALVFSLRILLIK